MSFGKRACLLTSFAGSLVLAAALGARADGLSVADQAVAPGAGFADAVAVAELAQARAGDFLSANITSQQQAVTQENNSANGDAGDVIVEVGAMDSLHGVGQIVANSGNLGVAQGNITMNVILNPPPASP